MNSNKFFSLKWLLTFITPKISKYLDVFDKKWLYNSLASFVTPVKIKNGPDAAFVCRNIMNPNPTQSDNIR